MLLPLLDFEWLYYVLFFCMTYYLIHVEEWICGLVVWMLPRFIRHNKLVIL